MPPGDCGLDDVSQILEVLPVADCMDGFVQGDSVHSPGNEVDVRFEGSPVVPPGGCFGASGSGLLQCPICVAPTVVGGAQQQLPCPLDVRFGDPFVVGNAFSDKVDKI